MARQVIKQRLELDGANVEEQLEQLGEVGERAFEQIADAAARVDFERLSRSVTQFGSDLATVGRRLSLALGLITAGATAATAAALSMAKAGSEAAAEAGEQATRLGLSIEAYNGLVFAAEQAGVAVEDIHSSLASVNGKIADELENMGKEADKAAKKLKKGFQPAVEVFADAGVTVRRYGKNVQDLDRPTKKAADGFASLGIALRDANGRIRTTDEILKDLADRIVRMPEGPQRLATAIQLLGKEAGPKLLPFLELGREGIERYYREATRAGIGFSKEQVRVGKELRASLSLLGRSIKATRDQFGLMFAPVFTGAADALRELVDENRAAIVEFGRVVALYGVRTIGDLLNAFAGNDAAVRQPWILEWRDAIVAFAADVQAVVTTIIIPAFQLIRSGAQLVADAINSIFGTDLSGGQVLLAATLLRILGVFRLVGSAAKVLVDVLRLVWSGLSALGAGSLVAGLGKVAGFFASMVRGALAFVPLIGGIIGWPALLIAGIAAATAAIVVFWDDIIAGAQAAVAYLQSFFSAGNFANVLAGVTQAANDAGRLLVDAFAVALRAIVGLMQANFTFIIGFFQGIIDRAVELAASLLPSWEQITAGASAIWQAFSDRATAAFAFVVEQANALASFLQPAWDAVSVAAAAVWTSFSAAATQAIDFVVAALAGAVTRVTEAVGTIAAAVFSAFTSATSEVVAAADQIREAITRATEIAGDVEGAEALAAALVAPFALASGDIDTILAALPGLAATAVAGIAGEFGKLRNQLSQVFSGVVSAIRSQLSSLESAVRSLVSRLSAELSRLRAAIASARAAASSGGSSSSSTPGLARGGAVWGAGTSTSDSILARLSNGEFVLQARAVRKYGIDFLRALNGMRLPKGALPGFSLGGLAEGLRSSLASVAPSSLTVAPVVAPATTGANMRPIMFQLPGGDIIEGIMASGDAIGQIKSYASSRQLTSAGRKPGWRT